MTTNRFSRQAFGGGIDGERLACEALESHMAALVPGTLVLATGAFGVVGGRIVGRGAGVEFKIDSGDGLTWNVDARHVEVQS
jgi:L-asparaginase II